ncbi:hypothetical protein IGA88_35250, partial [Pseudomonas aeruginosa]|nr:hypothetical protein [Pseudomonas aeruginosa]
ETLRSKYDAHFGSEPSTVFPGHEYWDDSAGVPAIDVFVYRKDRHQAIDSLFALEPVFPFGKRHDPQQVDGMGCRVEIVEQP